MAKRARSTRPISRHESRRGVGGSPQQGPEIGEGHRSFGGQRFCRSTVVDVCLQQARRAAQERLTAIQVEECQAFIQRSQNRLLKMEEERIAEQKELNAALVWLTRLREEMSRLPVPGPTQPASVQPVPPDPTVVELQQLRVRVAEMEMEREEFRKKRGRSLSVPSPDMPGASEQSIALFQHPARDRSSLMATLNESWRDHCWKFQSFQPVGMSSYWGSHSARDGMRVGSVQFVGARYGLCGVRVTISCCSTSVGPLCWIATSRRAYADAVG